MSHHLVENAVKSEPRSPLLFKEGPGVVLRPLAFNLP